MCSVSFDYQSTVQCMCVWVCECVFVMCVGGWNVCVLLNWLLKKRELRKKNNERTAEIEGALKCHWIQFCRTSLFVWVTLCLTDKDSKRKRMKRREGTKWSNLSVCTTLCLSSVVCNEVTERLNEWEGDEFYRWRWWWSPELTSLMVVVVQRRRWMREEEMKRKKRICLSA